MKLSFTILLSLTAVATADGALRGGSFEEAAIVENHQLE
jgi:hypothetical protein